MLCGVYTVASGMSYAHRVIAFDYDNTITRDEQHNHTHGSMTEIDSIMGSQARLHKIRLLFHALQANNVVILIVTFNQKPYVQSMLEKFGLLSCVTAIYDHHFIFKFVETIPCVSCRETNTNQAKQVFMLKYVAPAFHVDEKNMMLVDDQITNLDHGLSEHCAILHVDKHQTGYGVDDREIGIISDAFGLAAHSAVTSHHHPLRHRGSVR